MILDKLEEQTERITITGDCFWTCPPLTYKAIRKEGLQQCWEKSLSVHDSSSL
jgi:hypothetical protein